MGAATFGPPPLPPILQPSRVLYGGTVVAIMGGIFITGFGVLFLGIGLAILPLTSSSLGLVFVAEELAEIGLGIVVILAGRAVRNYPQHHLPLGGLTILGSVVALFLPPGGFFIGPILGALGGVVLLAGRPIPWTPGFSYPAPPPPGLPGAPLPEARSLLCPNCARRNLPGAAVCAVCGAPLVPGAVG